MARVARERAETVALAGLILQLVFAGVAFLLGNWNLSLANQVEAWHLLVGVPFWLVALVQLRARRRTDEEALEMERLDAARQAGRDHSLFAEGEAHAFVAKTRLRQLERYVVPAFSAVMALLLAGLATLLFTRLMKAGAPAAMQNQALSAAIMIGMAFFSFLFGMYAAGMARQREWRLLRAGASYLLSCALGSGAAGVVLGVSHIFKEDRPDIWVTYVILAAVCLAGVEILLNFIVDFYRPRIEGQEARPAYDSRLFGLLAEPSGILKTVSATLDYQFGFKISETWFYRFMERAIAPLFLFTLAAFYLLTCIVVIRPEEHAILERFGRPLTGRTAIGPGLHLKYPWPIDKVRRYPTDRIQMLRLGHELMDEDAKAEGEPTQAEEEAKAKKFRGVAEPMAIRKLERKDPRVILWDKQHYKKEHLVLVGMREEAKRKLLELPAGQEGEDKQPPVPVVLLSSHVEVHYRVRPEGLHDFLYNHAQPDALLEAIGYREIIRYLASVDMFEVMGRNREKASDDLKARIAAAAEREKLGVEIVFVGLQGVHPPVEGEVGKKFQEVIAAWQEKEAKILEAEGQANKIRGQTRYERRIRVNTARADRYQRVTLARAAAERFKTQADLDKRAPGVYRMRELLAAAEESLPTARKYVVAAKGIVSQRLMVDLKDQLTPELWRIGFKEQRPEEKQEE